MTLAEYRTTYSWQAAIALGPKLVRLTEDLPVHEQTGLVSRLQQLMVELPARIAQDLVDGTSNRYVEYHRLVAAVELIEGVYPALDTTEVRAATEALAERLMGAAFKQTTSESADEADDTDVNGPADGQDPEPHADASHDDAPAPVQRIANDYSNVPLQSMTHQQPTSVYVQPDRG